MANYGDVTKTSGGGTNNAGLPEGYRVTGIYTTKSGKQGFQDSTGNNWYSDDGSTYYRHTSHGRDWVTVNNPAQPAPAPESGGGEEGGWDFGSGGGGSGGYYTQPYAGYTGSAALDAQTQALMELINGLSTAIDALGKTTPEAIEEISAAGNGIGSTILSQYDAGKEKKKKSYLTPVSVED